MILLIVDDAEVLKTVRDVVIILSQPLKASKVSEYTPVESYVLFPTTIDSPLQIVSVIEVYELVELSQTQVLLKPIFYQSLLPNTIHCEFTGSFPASFVQDVSP